MYYIVVLNGGMFDCRLLAKNASLNISISVTYILFLTKMQKRQTLKKNLPLLNTISQILK